MMILYTGRRADLTDALKTLTEKKLAKLERFLNGSEDAHVILKLEKHRHLAEIVIRGHNTPLTARAEASDFRDSIGLCADRLLAQAKRQRERLSKERKRSGLRGTPRQPEMALPGGLPGAPAEGDHPAIVRMGAIPAKPMSIDEAARQADRSPEPFLIFRNAESQQIAVLFRRADGRFGLVEEEA